MPEIDALVPLLADDNRQNKNAANAGDGPKHAAWIACMQRLGNRLALVVETHAGGGIYQVPADSFCVGLPDASILGRHQRAAGFPTAPVGTTYYSASGDQALVLLPAAARYVAFDKEQRTTKRLALLAKARRRDAALEARPTSFKGNGDHRTAVSAVLTVCRPDATLLMVDPFGSGEFAPAKEAASRRVSSVVFGARMPNDPKFECEWMDLVRSFQSSLSAFEWTWAGSRQPGQKDSLRFYLLVGLAERADAEAVLATVRDEHAVFERERRQSHAYTGEIRHLWS